MVTATTTPGGAVGRSRRRFHFWLAPAASLLFLIGHLFVLAPTPASVDGVNFVLGVRDFDVADHRPHPPGYPLFIALGKASHLILPSRASAPLDRLRVETRALAVWSAIFGALAILPLLAIFRRFGQSDRLAWAATLVTVTSPLFWLLAMRPLSDITGLVVALAAQALLLTTISRRDVGAESAGATFPHRELPGVVAGLLSGLAIGIRTQAAWLTVPLLALVVARLWHERRACAGAMIAAFAVGVLIWSVPLVVVTGGLNGYFEAFRLQAAEQWRDEHILATSLAPGDLARALKTMVVSPFANPIVAVAAGAFGSIALAVKIVNRRESAKLLAVMYGPYLAFNVAFQDPRDARYALPLVPVVAYLVVRGLDLAVGRLMPAVVAALVVIGLSIAAPPMFAYAHAGNPVYRALGDAIGALNPDAQDQPVLAMHYSVARMLRGQRHPMRTLPARPNKEWRELVRYWQSGGASRVWFLANPARTDLALIDGASRRLVRNYEWPFDNRSLMTSARLRGVAWYEIDPPGWMLDEGWALTPETGGLAFAERRGLSDRPIRGYIRRRPDAMTLLIGGRRQRADASPAHRIEIRIDGALVEAWSEGESAFLKTWELPPGALVGSGAYATLEVAATAATADGPRPEIAIDQFDVQPRDAVVYGLDSGWYEQELDPGTGRTWRWTDRVATVRIDPVDRDVTVRIEAERPLNYLLRAPRIVMRAGGEILASTLADSDGDLSVAFRVPRAALDRADGVVTIQTMAPVDQQLNPNPDRPFPGLRVFDLSVEPAQNISSF